MMQISIVWPKDKVNVFKLGSTVLGWQFLSEMKFLTNNFFHIKEHLSTVFENLRIVWPCIFLMK